MRYVLKNKKVVESRHYVRWELAKKIVLALGRGVIPLALLLAPNAGRMLEIFGEDFLPEEKKRYNRKERIRRALMRLKKNRIVEIYKKGDATVVELTQTGKKRLLEYQLEHLELKKPRRWDGIWHIIIFDIPELKRNARDALTRKLRELGFLCLQKSVWVVPYRCQDEVDFIAEVFGVADFVHYVEARYIDDEEKLKLHFFYKQQ